MELRTRPIQEYLRYRFAPTAELAREECFPPGSSRLTCFIDFRRSPEAAVEPLVFYRVFGGGSTIHTALGQEYVMDERWDILRSRSPGCCGGSTIPNGRRARFSCASAPAWPWRNKFRRTPNA